MWQLSDYKNQQDTVTLRSGIPVPCVGFGTWKMPPAVAEEAVVHALQTGYRHIDTATAYCNEAGVGAGIKKSGCRREDVFLVTKLPNADHGYDKAKAAMDVALHDLGVEYVDAYLVHWPVIEEHKHRYEEDICETWQAVLDLKKEGKLRVAGVSNFMTEHLELLKKNGMELPEINQTQFHPQCTEKELRKYCEQERILVEAWSPLIQGQAFEREVLIRMAEKYQKSVAQICVRFCLQNHVLPVPKSTNPERMRSNADVFDFVISEEDMREIATLEALGRIGNDPSVPRKVQVVGF